MRFYYIETWGTAWEIWDYLKVSQLEEGVATSHDVKFLAPPLSFQFLNSMNK
jgi:hypothetical protein